MEKNDQSVRSIMAACVTDWQNTFELDIFSGFLLDYHPISRKFSFPLVYYWILHDLAKHRQGTFINLFAIVDETSGGALDHRPAGKTISSHGDILK